MIPGPDRTTAAGALPCCAVFTASPSVPPLPHLVTTFAFGQMLQADQINDSSCDPFPSPPNTVSPLVLSGAPMPQKGHSRPEHGNACMFSQHLHFAASCEHAFAKISACLTALSSIVHSSTTFSRPHICACRRRTAYSSSGPSTSSHSLQWKTRSSARWRCSKIWLWRPHLRMSSAIRHVTSQGAIEKHEDG